ncbi:MAG TPA: hypothetical protein VHL11_00380 [Phototrophicaceae bacterium]|nr:hypothetical protein [Phototrophicaceae bacterium]
MRPSFNVGDESILSEVWSLNGEEWLKLGERHEVQINLSYGERYLEKIVPGMKFKLQVASRIIGEGEVIAVE